MKIFSFDNKNKGIKRDPNQDGLHNLFQKNIVNTDGIALSLYTVPREFEMRLDKISNFIYGSPDYMEELMVLNDIISPYSVKEGQSIWYCSTSNFQNLYVTDTMLNDDTKRQSIIKSSQTNSKKQAKLDETSLPPTVKSNGLEQLQINKDNRVKIINSFQ